MKLACNKLQHAACSWPKPSQYQADPRSASHWLITGSTDHCHVAAHKARPHFPYSDCVWVCAPSPVDWKGPELTYLAKISTGDLFSTVPVTNSMIVYLKHADHGASLVAQWLRICLPMQGTRVRALVWGNPTCCGASRPVSHNH